MNPGFVGVTTVESQNELERLLKEYAGEQAWYFLRWPHRVSGFRAFPPDSFECAEGQIFTGDRELRWRSKGNQHSVLILKAIDSAADIEQLEQAFQPVRGRWGAQDRTAHVYPSTETQFPQRILHDGVDIGQRYFIDQTTGTVHFVALVAKESKP